MKIAVIGLGRLGAPLAILAASKGHHVLGVDIAATPVSAIRNRKLPVAETGLGALIRQVKTVEHPVGRGGGWLDAITTDEMELVASTELSLVVVPTPSQDDGSFTAEYVVDAVTAIGNAIAGSPSRHTVIVVSTLMPGSMGGPVRKALEKAAWRSVGDTLGFVYAPQLISLGQVLRDLTHPDLMIVGSLDPRSAEDAILFFGSLLENDAPMLCMGLEEAEVTKIGINAYLTMKMSFANVIGEIAARRGLDAQKIAAAVGADSRIGRKYLKPATGYGGPCFPRDNRAFAAFARKIGMPAELAEATDNVNSRQCDRVIDWIGRQDVVANQGVGILGLAYKPGTSVSEESAGMKVAAELVRFHVPTLVHDPEAVDIPGGTTLIPDAQDLVDQSAIVLIMTPWPEYATLKYGTKPVFDPWQIQENIRVKR